jgi:hypothetical protein
MHGLLAFCKQGTVCLFDRYIRFPKVFNTFWILRVCSFGVSPRHCVMIHLCSICKMLFKFHPFRVLKPQLKATWTHRHWLIIGASALRLLKGHSRLQPNVEFALYFTQHCPDVFGPMIGSYGIDASQLMFSPTLCSPTAPHDKGTSVLKSSLPLMVG